MNLGYPLPMWTVLIACAPAPDPPEIPPPVPPPEVVSVTAPPDPLPNRYSCGPYTGIHQVGTEWSYELVGVTDTDQRASVVVTAFDPSTGAVELTTNGSWWNLFAGGHSYVKVDTYLCADEGLLWSSSHQDTTGDSWYGTYTTYGWTEGFIDYTESATVTFDVPVLILPWNPVATGSQQVSYRGHRTELRNDEVVEDRDFSGQADLTVSTTMWGDNQQDVLVVDLYHPTTRDRFTWIRSLEEGIVEFDTYMPLISWLP